MNGYKTICTHSKPAYGKNRSLYFMMRLHKLVKEDGFHPLYKIVPLNVYTSTLLFFIIIIKFIDILVIFFTCIPLFLYDLIN